MATRSDIDVTRSLARRLAPIPGLEIREGEPLSRHTSFGIGGPADVLAIPSSPLALSELVRIAADVGIEPLYLGNGTNLIVRDGGIRGLVVRMAGGLSDITVEGRMAVVEAGASLATVCFQCAQRGLAGLEFAAGIPGTLGGALIMNAGANGGEIGDVTEWVDVVSPDGDIDRLPCDELNFGYRCSALRERGLAVLRAGLHLEPGEPERIHRRLCDAMAARCATQPVTMPSAGSIFKRPEDDYAGRLLEEAGAKGMRVGGAAVSTKHANFVVNLGGATASDVIRLIERARDLVHERLGIVLEPEVCIAGEDR
ncbi:MAG: UDP-N-acetylmuramate dehydrogenase [Armatimonadota bacterium]|nr:UDP-N-acetylmuramate dehydrogenase [Armatimonadota bacterium]